MTFTDVHTGRQKVPKSDFQSHFPMSKNVRIFLKKNSNDFWHRKLTLKVRFRHFLTTHVNICESQIKKLCFFYCFFAKIKPLLTHVRKTPPLRSHYWSYLPICIIVWYRWNRSQNFKCSNVYPSNFRNELVDLTQNCAVLNSPNQS